MCDNSGGVKLEPEISHTSRVVTLEDAPGLVDHLRRASAEHHLTTNTTTNAHTLKEVDSTPNP